MEPWPLSAAATAVLLRPWLSTHEALRLALSELVLNRAWELEWRGGSERSSARVHFVSGSEPVDGLAPLPRVDAALRTVVGVRGLPVRTAIERMLRDHQDLGKEARSEAQQVLVRRGLLRLEQGKVLGILAKRTLAPTPEGLEVRAEAARRCARAATPGDVRALGGLVLLMRPKRREELSAELRRDWNDPDAVERLEGLGEDFASALDAGISDGGGPDGGDGGGGGG